MATSYHGGKVLVDILFENFKLVQYLEFLLVSMFEFVLMEGIDWVVHVSVRPVLVLVLL